MRLTGLFLLAAGVALAAVTPSSVDNFWLPVSDAEKAMKAPVVDKDAGVEALFWRVHVMDDWNSDKVERVSVHYVRLKVFSEEGKRKAATLDIHYGDRSSIAYIAGRTIKPDGTILELSKDAIHDRVDVQTGSQKQNVTSFAMPGVEVGSIIEYRWREIEDSNYILYLRLQFQHEFPIQHATYFVRPLSGPYNTYKMSIWPFNCTPALWKMDADGFYMTTLESIPAFRSEPMMPGEPNVRQWALVFYHEDMSRDDPEKYWDHIGRDSYKTLKAALKTNDELKKIASTAVEGAKTDDEKALRLIRWIHANVRNLWSPQVSADERARLLKKMPRGRVRMSVEVYKSGMGDSDEMNTLFAALAMEVGMDARPVLVGSRDEILFNKHLAERYFLRSVDMAVAVDGKWKIYDVSAHLLPAGMLSWREEGVSALVADPKEPEFITSRVSAPEESLSGRKGRFTLTEEGTLEGDVDETWTGHAAEQRRREMDGESAERQQEVAKDRLVRVFPQAEVSNLHLENTDNAELPLHVSYHVRIPGYAARTGKRLLFQPLYFERGQAPVFSADERKYDIVFPWAWSEKDGVSIALPAGYRLERPENPGSLDFGAPGYYELAMTQRGNTLVCVRSLVFGRNASIGFPRDGYAHLKGAFDDIHRRDEVTFSLEKVEVGKEAGK